MANENRLVLTAQDAVAKAEQELSTSRYIAECYLKSIDKCLNTKCRECEYFSIPSKPIRICQAYMVADDLIAHGVTVQEWISVKDRLPTEDEDSNYRIVGVVNGYNGKTRFTDAEIFVRYCHTENAWWSDDYDIGGCTVEKFYVVPKPPKGE